MHPECISGTVVEYFPARKRIYTSLAYIRWTTRKSDRSPRDRFSRAHIRGRKEISAMPPSGAALYPSSRSVHVRRNSDPAGIASGISKTDYVGGRTSDLWCNANLSEFYSPPLPPPSPPVFPSPFLVFLSLTLARDAKETTARGQNRGKDEVETAADSGS